MEGRPGDLEVDRVPEALAVPGPARHPLDPLDPRVRPLRHPVRPIDHGRLDKRVEV
jgi:hypothetical protein